MSDELPATIEINGQTYVRVTNQTLADTFCDMGSDEQAAFLNAVAEESAGWAGKRLFQWESMRKDLTPAGIQLIREWAEYFIPENR